MEQKRTIKNMKEGISDCENGKGKGEEIEVHWEL